MHISGKECNNCNRSENRNQCNSGFKTIKFHKKIENSENRDWCKFPGMLRSEYHHWYLLHTHTKFQHLVTVLPRDMEWTMFSSISPVRRKCSFEAINFKMKNTFLKRFSFFHAVWVCASFASFLNKLADLWRSLHNAALLQTGCFPGAKTSKGYRQCDSSYSYVFQPCVTCSIYKLVFFATRIVPGKKNDSCVAKHRNKILPVFIHFVQAVVYLTAV